MDGGRPLAPPADALRLHRLSPVLSLAPLLRQLLVPLAVVMFGNWQIGLPVIAGGLALLLIPTALRAHFTRYTLDGEQLLVWRGVLQRSMRVVSPARVQQVDVIRQLRHRATGVAAVRIELAETGTGSSRLELDALTVTEAERVRDVLERGRRNLTAVGGIDVPAPPPAPLLQLSTRQLVVAGLTGAPVLLVPPLIVSVMFEVLDIFRLGGVDAVRPGRIPFLVLGAVVIVLWPAVAGGVMVFRCHGYTLGRSGDDLVSTRGLLDTRTSVLPLARVQLVDRATTILRRWLDLTQVEIRTASGGTTTQYPAGVTVPIAPAGAVHDLIALVLARPSLPLDVVPHPRSAQRRAILRRFVPLGPGLVALTTVTAVANDVAGSGLLGIAAASAAVAFALAVVWGRSWYRRLGHTRCEGVLIVRTGVLVEHLRLTPLDRIQSVIVTQSPFQQRAGVCTARALLAGGSVSVKLPDLDPADALALAIAVQGLSAVDTEHWAGALSGRA